MAAPTEIVGMNVGVVVLELARSVATPTVQIVAIQVAREVVTTLVIIHVNVTIDINS